VSIRPSPAISAIAIVANGSVLAKPYAAARAAVDRSKQALESARQHVHKRQYRCEIASMNGVLKTLGTIATSIDGIPHVAIDRGAVDLQVDGVTDESD
jgi:hypothetical protein